MIYSAACDVNKTSPGQAQKYYCSFYLQGIEKQMLNPNVALTDLGVLLLMADNMDMPSGVELVPPKEDE